MERLKIEVKFSPSISLPIGYVFNSEDPFPHHAFFFDDKGVFFGTIDPTNDLPTVRNFGFAVVQYIADVYTIAKRCAYLYSIENVAVVDEIKSVVEFSCEEPEIQDWHSLAYPAHGLEDFTIFLENSTKRIIYSQEEVVEMLLKNGAHLFAINQFRRAIFYASAAIRYPDLSAMFSNQAVEAIREYFGGKDNKAKYEVMRARLGVQTELAIFKDRETRESVQEEKHGKFITRAWPDRRLYIENSSRILFSFAVWLVKNNPLWESQ
jgi:hypothetical protein